MNNDFRFFVPADLIEKAKGENGEEVMTVKGIASTANKDSQDESLDPSGFDLSDFKYINYNHKGKDDPSTIIGEPTLAKITPQNELYIEGILYPEVPMAKSTWALMKALKNSPRGNKLCLSVEGKVTERDPMNSKKILKSKITAVAICPVPVNGDTWVDFLQKGYTNNDDLKFEEEEENKEEKAIDTTTTAVIGKESVEHEGEKRIMKKSSIYESIFTQYPNIEIDEAKSVYQLIEKISNMEKSEVTKETLDKAFDILDLAKSETEKELEKGKKEEVKKDEEEEGEDQEMMNKAKKLYKSMKVEGKTDEEITSTLIKKGFNESMALKAIEKSSSNDLNVDELKDEFSKGFSNIAELFKSSNDSINKKFAALGEIFKSQSEEISDLKKSLDGAAEINTTLKEEIEKISKTPFPAKSIKAVSYSERFAKSDNGEEVYNLAHPQDRKVLADKLEDMSGINKGENYDEELMRGAQDLEISKSLDQRVISRLAGMNIKVVTEA